MKKQLTNRAWAHCEPLHLQWSPSVPFTVDIVDELLTWPHVVFVGDSLMKLQFHALSCRAEALHANLSHVTFVESHFLTLVDQHAFHFGMLDASVAAITDALVVVGVGTWYNPFKLGELLEWSAELSARRQIGETNALFEKSLQSGLDTLAQQKGVQVVVRSLVPGHARCKSHKEAKGHLAKYDYPGMHRRNLILKRIARRMGLAFLDLWTPSLDRPDSHPASHFEGLSSIAHDCLHHCFSPWSVLPTWNALLAQFLDNMEKSAAQSTTPTKT